MKKITFTLLLISSIVFSQKHHLQYDKLWKEVSSFEQKSLPKSALKVVDKIYKKAQKEQNTSQMVKSFLYQSKYTMILEEDAMLKIVQRIKTQIDRAKFPTKNIFENVLANMYWQYFQQNRWRFYDRTNTKSKVDTTDFRTWDLRTLFNEIHLYFQKSLENAEQLQQFPLEKIKSLLIIEKEAKKYQPTLFDFLSYNALNFYKTPENNLSQPADKFEIDDEKYLSDYKEFIKIVISDKKYISLQKEALVIYQKLLQFHSKNNRKNALIVADLERLKFVKNNAIFKHKNDLFFKALYRLKDAFPSSEFSTLVDYEIAYFLVKQTNDFSEKIDEKYKLNRVKAHQICEKAIQKLPKSLGAKQCKKLLKEIEGKKIKIENETYIPIEKHSRIKVSYRNIDHLYFQVFSMNEKEKQQLYSQSNKGVKLRVIKNFKKATSFEKQLINKGDYLVHSTELVFPPLSKGQYVVVVSSEPKPQKPNTYSIYTIQVTNIALIEKSSDKIQGYQVLDRVTGEPLKNAKIHLTNENVRYGSKIDKMLVSDKNGMAEMKKNSKNYYNIQAKVIYGKDVAYFNDYDIHKFWDMDKISGGYGVYNLFTDRVIYRPNQTVYFKGIIYERDDYDRINVVTNQEFSVHLFRKGYSKKVASLTLKTNEFGSFSGSFVLPKEFTGSYHIEVESNDKDYSLFTRTFAYFAVEEYKRPKFEVFFNPLAKSYQLNDKITVSGMAKSYSGSAVSNAKVVYRVKRATRFPRWCYWFFPNISSDEQEIVNNTTTTDAEGNFKIDFTALPDKQISPDQQPIFTYTISADITDINGETQTTETTVKIGYQAMQLAITSANKIEKKEDLKIKVKATNLNNVPIENKGKMRIYKLQSPDRVLKKRLWKKPIDIPMKKEEFYLYFPFSPYDKEDDHFYQWKNGNLVWQGDYKSETEIVISEREMKKWDIGKYKIEVESKDRFGQKVTDTQFITISDFNSDKIADNQLFSINLNKKAYEIGEEVKVRLATASKNLVLTLTVERQGKITETKVIRLNNEVKELSFPMYKTDDNGFAIHYNYVFENSFQSGTLIIPIKEEKEELSIETEVFRDKLQPGQQEIWRFKVKNTSKKDKVSEVLASMYDASLDQFHEHQWKLRTPHFRSYSSEYEIKSKKSFDVKTFSYRWYLYDYYSYFELKFNSFNWFGFHFSDRSHNTLLRMRGEYVLESTEVDEEQELVEDVPNPNEIRVGYSRAKKSEMTGTLNDNLDFSSIKIRKNFDETAFFYPHLKTDKEGNVSFEFTTPEALTTWKLQLLAHTKTMGVAHKILETKTQKELMVIPNAPRFLREGDTIEFMTKIANISDKKLSGMANLELTDAFTGKPINALFDHQMTTKEFTVDKNGTTFVQWKLAVPKQVQAVQYKVVAKSEEFSDGEQNVLPILSNRKLVTETMPLWLSEEGSKTVTFEKLKSSKSTTLHHQNYSLEISTNPSWYAVQSLPYLMEHTTECNEHLFAQFYANALGMHIVKSKPIIEKVFNQWANSDELISNLEKNQELKEILIEETPWLREVQSETEQKKRIALLFKVNTMKYELKNTLEKLAKRQNNDGSWSWFSGGYPSRWITQHIVAGLGHLEKLGVATSSKEIVQKALNYLDNEFVNQYEELKRNKVKMTDNNLSAMQLHYLYLRSFYPNYTMSAKVKKVRNYYLSQIDTYWSESSLYDRGLMSLISFRANKTTTAKAILQSLRENSIYNEEMGMYWKANTAGYFYYQAPIETQALLIEAFAEIEKDTATVDKLKMWLLKNKQTNRWRTTKATTEAIYALLLQGSDWLKMENEVTIKVGNETVVPSDEYRKSISAGTGYFKTSWNAKDINSEKATITISKKGKGMIWGGVYWQYFEDLDKISASKTALKVSKKLFLKKDTALGKQLEEITQNTSVKVGDLITCRVEISVDRPMEFVHLKDMRASGLEPVNVFSSYKWQDGLGYYESTRDTATHFFFDILRKGIYVFEYDLRVNNAGVFSNGIATLQCMYAPEFSSHSRGERLEVGD
ncbi:MAG: alpha-2-macroglobulin [Flavobacteriaceae bacterium]|nr:alpha-2-macroglobulin [Flavobacteriaceae bacterium]